MHVANKILAITFMVPRNGSWERTLQSKRIQSLTQVSFERIYRQQITAITFILHIYNPTTMKRKKKSLFTKVKKLLRRDKDTKMDITFFTQKDDSKVFDLNLLSYFFLSYSTLNYRIIGLNTGCWSGSFIYRKTVLPSQN